MPIIIYASYLIQQSRCPDSPLFTADVGYIGLSRSFVDQTGIITSIACLQEFSAGPSAYSSASPLPFFPLPPSFPLPSSLLPTPPFSPLLSPSTPAPLPRPPGPLVPEHTRPRPLFRINERERRMHMICTTIYYTRTSTTKSHVRSSPSTAIGAAAQISPCTAGGPQDIIPPRSRHCRVSSVALSPSCAENSGRTWHSGE